VRLGHVLATAILLTLPALPAAAELAVLTNGRILKVDSFALEGDAMRLDLPGGGVLRLAVALVERVVDDEVVPDPEPIPAVSFALGFSPAAVPPETPFGDRIFETARSYGVNPRLVAAMVSAESAFDARAVSHKGARGLLQLMPATAARFGVASDALFDPEQNLAAGVRYLSWLIERYDDDLPLVLAAYNAGEGNVDRYEGVPPFRETRGYIRRVYSWLGLGDAPLSATR
jgi:hypothetical protein